MKKLTIKQKREILQKIKKSGWNGCMCDNCLLKIAYLVWQYQEKNNLGDK